jgi:hypothetical protein
LRGSKSGVLAAPETGSVENDRFEIPPIAKHSGRGYPVEIGTYRHLLAIERLRFSSASGTKVPKVQTYY